MNNVQANGRVNFKLESNNVEHNQSVELNNQTPDQLKQKVESGEINEKDFPSREDYERFLTFLATVFDGSIKPYSNSEVLQKTELNASIIQNKKDMATEQINKLSANNEKANPLQDTESNANNYKKSSEMEILKEGLNNPAARQMASDANVLVSTQSNNPQTGLDLFKADNIDKSTFIKDQAVIINDKTIVLHTSGGNNLSITGNEIGAQGDINFVDEARTFAEQEGFKEKSNQQQPTEDDMTDLEQVYFTKDRDQ